ncbi:hypothetical protein NDU88_003922 [Pleurodeles waltl]|uniref:Uncharacterized protein n=1 Tax=Pleurodeles waltl TaxID=8319 RepID=A0AAV7PFZ9_PLEWA|nr:hypothetical protein NDU88_003922 [Pleurodeles waltl]
MQSYCCLRLQGEDSVDPREISSELLVQRGGRLPQSMHHLETVEKAGRMKRYKVASSRLATLLRFCRHPEQSAVDPLVEDIFIGINGRSTGSRVSANNKKGGFLGERDGHHRL